MNEEYYSFMDLNGKMDGKKNGERANIFALIAISASHNEQL